MDAKDYFYAFGIIGTFVLGAWNFIQMHRSARKASFINTVTSQRVLWLERLRDDVSKFVGLTHNWAMSQHDGEAGNSDSLQEIDRLRHLIRLRLNPKDAPDQQIAELIKKIPELTHESRRDDLLETVEELTVQTQEMLKNEWDKVKAESKYGDLNELKSDGASRRESVPGALNGAAEILLLLAPVFLVALLLAIADKGLYYIFSLPELPLVAFYVFCMALRDGVNSAMFLENRRLVLRVTGGIYGYLAMALLSVGAFVASFGVSHGFASFPKQGDSLAILNTVLLVASVGMWIMGRLIQRGADDG